MTKSTKSTKAGSTTKRARKNATLQPTEQVAQEQAAEAIALNEQAAQTETKTDAPAKPAKAVKEPKPMPTLAEAFDKAKAEQPVRYARVARVVELAKDGSPKRVVIVCSDPQTKMVDGKPVSVCQHEREIAVQDLFQVECCAACADRKVRKARRNRAKRRDKQLRAQVRAAKAAR